MSLFSAPSTNEEDAFFLGDSDSEDDDSQLATSGSSQQARHEIQQMRKKHKFFYPPFKSLVTVTSLESMDAAFFDADHNRYSTPPNAQQQEWIMDLVHGTTDPGSSVVMYVLVPNNIPTIVQPVHPTMIARVVTPKQPDPVPDKWVVFSSATAQWKGRITHLSLKRRERAGYVLIESLQQL